jgi:hypothetical protein
VPITFTLTQNGSTVSGFQIITCALCGPGRSNVTGTASGNVATVSFTTVGATTPSIQGATLTISGATMTTAWPGGNGALISGTLTSSAPPTTAGPAPPSAPSPPPTTSAHTVNITQSACTVLSRDSFRTHYSITASGDVTGPDNAGLVVSSNVSGGGLVETVSCGSWSRAPASDLGTDCRRQSGNPATTNWSVAYTNYSLGHQQVDGGFVISAHAKNATSGNFSDSFSVALDCAR